MMKSIFFLVLLSLIALGGCASISNDKFILRVMQHVPESTKKYITDRAPDEVAGLVMSGLQKLSLDELYRFNFLKLQVLKSSPENCQSMVESRSITSPKKDVAYHSLTPEEFDEFSKIIAKTLDLSLNHDFKEAPRPSEEEFRKAVVVVTNDPTSGLTRKFLETTKMDLLDQCWFYTKVATYIDSKRNRIAETLVRYITVP